MHRDRITIQTNASTADNPAQTWTGTLVTNWPCTIKSVGGGEQIRGRQIEPHITWVVEAHWGGDIKDVTQAMRILVTAGEYTNRILNIEKILPVSRVGKPHIMSMDCTESVDT